MLLVIFLQARTYPEIVKELKERMQEFDLEGAQYYIEFLKIWENFTEVHLEVGLPSPDEGNMLAKMKNYFDIAKTKTNQNYRKGRSFEYRCMDKLRKKGWDCIRSFGSWGPADIRAFRDGVMLYIQCKWSVHGETQPDHYELTGLVDMAAQYGGVPIFAGISKRRIYFVHLLTGEEYDFD